ncbi:MAG: hypothetical protein E6K66_10470 [Nitrospirae bacterium]|nr:MAG: hypothetical protein E6K66_10470 [Nitrospirota bacterium]
MTTSIGGARPEATDPPLSVAPSNNGGEGRAESAGNVTHAHCGVTVSGRAHTTDQRGHFTKEVEISPKKDDVALLAVISLGYDFPRTLAAS